MKCLRVFLASSLLVSCAGFSPAPLGAEVKLVVSACASCGEETCICAEAPCELEGELAELAREHPLLTRATALTLLFSGGALTGWVGGKCAAWAGDAVTARVAPRADLRLVVWCVSAAVAGSFYKAVVGTELSRVQAKLLSVFGKSRVFYRHLTNALTYIAAGGSLEDLPDAAVASLWCYFRAALQAGKALLKA